MNGAANLSHPVLSAFLNFDNRDCAVGLHQAGEGSFRSYRVLALDNFSQFDPDRVEASNTLFYEIKNYLQGLDGHGGNFDNDGLKESFLLKKIENRFVYKMLMATSHEFKESVVRKVVEVFKAEQSELPEKLQPFPMLKHRGYASVQQGMQEIFEQKLSADNPLYILTKFIVLKLMNLPLETQCSEATSKVQSTMAYFHESYESQPRRHSKMSEEYNRFLPIVKEFLKHDHVRETWQAVDCHVKPSPSQEEPRQNRSNVHQTQPPRPSAHTRTEPHQSMLRSLEQRLAAAINNDDHAEIFQALAVSLSIQDKILGMDDVQTAIFETNKRLRRTVEAKRTLEIIHQALNKVRSEPNQRALLDAICRDDHAEVTRLVKSGLVDLTEERAQTAIFEKSKSKDAAGKKTHGILLDGIDALKTWEAQRDFLDAIRRNDHSEVTRLMESSWVDLRDPDMKEELESLRLDKLADSYRSCAARKTYNLLNSGRGL